MSKSKLTSHQPGLPLQEPVLTSHMRISARRVPTVPKVGQSIAIDINKVAFDNNEDGSPKTPMTKARYNVRTQQWQQVSVAEAGLLMFFNTAPPDDCTKVRVVSIIPSGRACYVEPE